MQNELHFLHPRAWSIKLLFGAGFISMILGAIGAYWDIAWHFDFGRDTFWSLPHFMIYGQVTLMTLFFALNLVLAIRHDMPHKRHALFILLLFAIGGVVIQYLSAPLDELWHRLYGIDVQIFSPPHLMLLFGAIFGTVAVIGMVKYHVLHEHHRFLLEKILIPTFLGGTLTALILVFAESEFTTLPSWHPVQSRPAWVYPGFALTFALMVFVSAKYASNLRFAATLTFLAYALLRMLPVLFNWFIGMVSIPIIPPFLPILLLIAIALDIAWVTL